MLALLFSASAIVASVLLLLVTTGAQERLEPALEPVLPHLAHLERQPDAGAARSAAARVPGVGRCASHSTRV
jgi:hypothetical protein